jgi:hypothetical protein
MKTTRLQIAAAKLGDCMVGSASGHRHCGEGRTRPFTSCRARHSRITARVSSCTMSSIDTFTRHVHAELRIRTIEGCEALLDDPPRELRVELGWPWPLPGTRPGKGSWADAATVTLQRSAVFPANAERRRISLPSTTEGKTEEPTGVVETACVQEEMTGNGWPASVK